MQKLHYAIALSGGIGTGKSTAASIFRLLGYKVIDADKIAHELLQKYKNEVAELFGEEILKDEKIERKALGKIVFGNLSELKKLENLLHPPIRAEILAQAEALEALGFPYFVDIPLFFEKRTSYEAIQKSVLVYAPKSVQKERISLRDGLLDTEIEARLNAQMDIEKKRALADYVLPNYGSLEELTSACEAMSERIKKELV
ncbi:MAG: dephospho-CoA kinase [Wolinella sp.]